MRLEVKLVGAISLLFFFGITPILSLEDTTIYSETTQSYLNSFDTKCIAQSEYDILIGSFIKQLVKEIQLNRSSEAMETLNKISPNDDRYVQDIVFEALKQPDVELSHLLEFINKSTVPTTTFDGMSTIFTFLNNTKYAEDGYNRGPLFRTVLKWLALQHFARDFVDRYGNDSAISTDIIAFSSAVRAKAKSVVLSTTINSLLRNDDFNRGKIKYATEYLNFIIESYFNNGNSTVASVTRTIESLYSFYEKTTCVSLIALYNLIGNSATPNDTFKLMPNFKFLSKQSYRKCDIKKLNLKNGSLFEKVLSENYFHLKNVFSGEYLYVKQNKRATGKHSFIIKTVSGTDSDKIDWKFSAYEHSRSDRMLMTINNENYPNINLRALPCLVHDNESIVQMQNGKYHNDEMMNDAWNIEVDDVSSERFRLQNDFTKSYLAVGISKNQSNIILVDELNSENSDSAHWTLEVIVEE